MSLDSPREGHVENFFGSWSTENANNLDNFNPGQDWSIIFNIP
jgi:hypothetical protein